MALIESDEAAFKAVSTYVDAKVVVVTNVFRDQLDRYGEVTHTLNNIKTGISHSSNAVLCLNADDSLSSSLASEVDNPVLYYGVDVPIYRDRVAELSDAPYCIRCKHAYVYDYVTYGHLGQLPLPFVRLLPAQHGCLCLQGDLLGRGEIGGGILRGRKHLSFHHQPARAATTSITPAPPWHAVRLWGWISRWWLALSPPFPADLDAWKNLRSRVRRFG